MLNLAKFAKYTFQGRSGYIIGSSNASTAHQLVAVRHTSSVTPWTDPEIHKHENSEEYYILLQGELRLLVAESSVTLKPREILAVKPQVAHAIIGGEGPIEHFGIRAPNLNDKHIVGEIPQRLLQGIEEERELQRDWGFRVSLEVAKNRNCWLIGAGAARFHSPHLIFAYLDFPTAEAASAGMGTRHRLHFHQRSWEYYAVLKGTSTLQVDNELVRIEAGEILEVSPQVSHTLHGRQAPFEGFTFRVPAELNDKVECSELSDHN
ncbi:MAG: cupin domain-containing protein [Chloroflexota bacterium]